VRRSSFIGNPQQHIAVIRLGAHQHTGFAHLLPGKPYRRISPLLRHGHAEFDLLQSPCSYIP
jgi:hypothetical protein